MSHILYEEGYIEEQATAAIAAKGPGSYLCDPSVSLVPLTETIQVDSCLDES